MQIALAEREVFAEGHQASKGFTLQPNAHMMGILSGLYSDIPWAIVREYATNMLDGYVKLRRDNPSATVRPPEIHLPSTMSPYVEFKDFGAGMDFDTVWSVFTEYGASTKRDNNEEVGGLGLGSKTAFCYGPADPWIIESRFNHKRMIFHASKDNTHIPTLHHVATLDSVEPNGVTIRIPVAPSDFVPFKNAVRRLLPFYPMDVQVTGDPGFTFEKPKYIIEGNGWGLRKKENLLSQVIMGNVPYPVGHYQMIEHAGLPHDLFNRYSLDLRVPIGAVSFVPSREALKFDEHTAATLKAYGEKFLAEFQAIITDRIKTAPTKWAALTAMAEVDGISALRGHITGITWRNQVIDIHEGIKFQIHPFPTDPAVSRIPTTVGYVDLVKKFPTIRAERYDNSGVRNKVRRSEVSSGQFLPMHKYEYAFLNDLPEKGLVERVRQWMFNTLELSQHHRYAGEVGDATVFFGEGITKEQLSKALGGIPVRLTSELPEPLINGRPKGPRRKTMVKMWRHDDWEPVEIDEEEEIQAYYVKLEGANELVDFPGNNGDVERMWDAVRNAGLVPRDAVLFGIPRTLKRLEKRQDWKELLGAILPMANDYVVEHAQEAADSLAWNDYRYDEFVKLLLALDRTKLRDGTPAALLWDAADAANALHTRLDPLRNIEHAFNIEAPPRVPAFKPESLIKKCTKRYPMAQIIADKFHAYHLGTTEKEAITQYINSIK